MGEPLLNVANVVPAMGNYNLDDFAYGLSKTSCDFYPLLAFVPALDNLSKMIDNGFGYFITCPKRIT